MAQVASLRSHGGRDTGCPVLSASKVRCPLQLPISPGGAIQSHIQMFQVTGGAVGSRVRGHSAKNMGPERRGSSDKEPSRQASKAMFIGSYLFPGIWKL